MEYHWYWMLMRLSLNWIALKLLSKQCKYNAKKQFQTVCREKCPTLDDGDSEKLSEIENKLLTK